jgi:hypothetical protein
MATLRAGELHVRRYFLDDQLLNQSSKFSGAARD